MFNKIKREFSIELTTEEELLILRKYALKKPEILSILLEHPKGDCPFPDGCSSFPCKTLSCNADVCDNGHAYRFS